MKRIVLTITIALSIIMLSSCNIEKTYKVKDFISAQNYNKAIIPHKSLAEGIPLSESEFANFVPFLDSVFDLNATLASSDDFIKIDGSPFTKKDETLLTPPMLPPVNTTYYFYAYNETSVDDGVWFVYNYNEETSELSLFIKDLKTNVSCKVDVTKNNANRLIYDFGHEINYIYVEHYLKNFDILKAYPFLESMNSENVSSIELSSIFSGVRPMSLNKHFYYTSTDKITKLLDTIKSAKFELYESSPIYVPGGVTNNIVIKTNNDEYLIEFYDGYLVYEKQFFRLTSESKMEEAILPDQVLYSFNIDEFSGELYYIENRYSIITFDLSDIRFEIIEDLSIVKYEYYIQGTYGSLYLSKDGNYIGFENNNYRVIYGSESIKSQLDKVQAEKIDFISNPKMITSEQFNKLMIYDVTYPEGPQLISNKIYSLEAYKNADYLNLAEILGFDESLSNYDIATNYSIIKIVRSGPPHDEFKNIIYYDIFTEYNKLYASIKIKAKSTGPFDAAIVNYVDYLVVPNGFVTGIGKYFTVTYNTYYSLDGVTFNNLVYDDVEKIKNAFRKSKYGLDHQVYYEVNIAHTFGSENGVTAVMINAKGIDHLPVETEVIVGDYTFVYPNSNEILVYANDKIYSLQEAYNMNLVSNEFLASIHHRFNTMFHIIF